VQDFYRDEHDQRIYLALIVPIFDKLNGNQPLGAIVLRIDPTLYLYPFIQSWPTPSNSAETLLVRLDENQILYLNDLRFQSNAALQLSQPLLGNTEITGIGIIMGQRGIQEGLDYRGVPVIAAIADVPGSPWYLVTKMDTADVYATLHERMWKILLLMVLLIGGLGTVMFLLWRRQQLVLEKGQFESTLKLKKNEETHQLILNTIMDGFLRLDREARVLEVNPAYCRMSGYSEKELLTLSVHDLNAESPEDISAHIQKIIAQGENRFETRHRRKDGSIYEVEVSAQFQPSEDGQFVVFLHDISKRILAKMTLMKSEAQLIFALQKDNTGVWELNLRDNTAHRTLLHDQIFGYEALLPTWTYEMFLDHVLPEDRPEVDRLFHQALAAQEEWSFECRINRADGEMRWIYVAGDYVRNSKGEPDHLSGIVQDITKAKMAEMALRESELKFKALADTSPLAIYMSSGLDQKGEYINPTFTKLFGYTMDDVGTVEDWWPRAYPDKTYRRQIVDEWQGKLEHAIETGSEIVPMEVLVTCKDGSHKTIQWGFKTIGKQNWAFGLDITERKQAEQSLRDALTKAQRFSEALDNIPTYVYMKDLNHRYIYANKITLKLFNCSAEELVGSDDARFFPPETILRLKSLDDKVFEHAETNVEEVEVSPDKPERRVYLETKTPIYDEAGEICGLCGISTDITELKQNAEKLQLAASVFTHAHEGIIITDATGHIIDVNEAFICITGYEHDEVLGQNPRILKSGRHKEEFYAEMWHDLQINSRWSGEIWNQRKNGDVYAELINISALRNAEGEIQRYIALFSDITALKTYEQKLERSAHYDALTNLPNRTLLADRLRQGIAQVKRRGNRLVVAFIDLDGFKDINDKYGHDAGDHLLIALATRMKNALREGDTLARIGGDEFVAVLFDLPDIEASVPMLGRLQTAAAQPVQVDNFTLQVSASIGLTFYPQTEDIDADQLLRQADQAMYQAKQSGKNRYHFFNTDQDRIVRSHHEDLERIRRALFTQELVLYYQPKVNMRTGTVIGAEALIRWQHPERGLLPPLAFLPGLEDDPLSVELGKWVIDTALTEMEHWRAVGLDIPVSVNVSSRQLQQIDFVERLREVLATHPSLSLGELELEVLETSALKDLTRVSQIIEDCRELGVMFALDDFGTGYSSLTYLKRLPVSQIKIDQSFVRDVLNDADDLPIIRGVLALANAFQLQVIAEGVETIKHGELLLQLGCDLGQGYGIAPPMPAADFPGWLATWLPDPTWVDRPSLNHDDLSHKVIRKNNPAPL
jgi:diguanylate cyclase (GGDEF)-like protein/PAS domain S-box-containing protein